MRPVVSNFGSLRAVVALIAAVTLTVSVVFMDRSHTHKKASVVREINAMLWGLTELNFEAQRLMIALDEVRRNPARISDARVRFDVVWTRVGIIRTERFPEGSGFHAHIASWKETLERFDPLLYGEQPLSEAQIDKITQSISKLAVTNRQLWLRNYGIRNAPKEILEALEEPRSLTLTELSIIAVLALLMGYVVLELALSERLKERERALRRKASQANEAKTQFIAKVSHEVRTPLNGILGMVQVLRDSSLSPSQVEAVETIADSGDLLLSTINDVLDVSKIEAGKMTFTNEHFNLLSCLNRVISLYQPNAQAKGLLIERDFDFPPDMQVTLDPRRLRQVLGNLLSNATKFTEHGTITLAVTACPRADDVLFEIIDSGVGIAPEDQENVFKPFVQAHAGSTNSVAGTGLGLTISRQIAHAMGGSLELESNLGVGTTFSVRLPASQEVTQPADKLQLHFDNCRKEPALGALRENLGFIAGAPSVLIVDDNKTNRLILERFLAQHVQDIRQCASGEDALRAFSKRPCDIVLMDVEMPRMTGPEATERLRKLPGGKDAVVIAVTANVLPEQIAAYRASGMDLVFSKPVSKADLLDTLFVRKAA